MSEKPDSKNPDDKEEDPSLFGKIVLIIIIFILFIVGFVLTLAYKKRNLVLKGITLATGIPVGMILN